MGLDGLCGIGSPAAEEVRERRDGVLVERTVRVVNVDLYLFAPVGAPHIKITRRTGQGLTAERLLGYRVTHEAGSTPALVLALLGRRGSALAGQGRPLALDTSTRNRARDRYQQRQYR